MVLTIHRKILCLLLSVCLLSVPAAAAVDPAPEISAKAAVLVHPASGRVLYAVNEDMPLLIASTTKLMTALVAVRNVPLEKRVRIRPEWTGAEGSSMYLRTGEEYSVRELLEGLLLASGNDAALALAGITAGNEAAFAEKMNECAAELGLQNTHFENPHGLDAPGHCSSASDLARIMADVCKHETLLSILGERSCRIRDLSLENHNKLLSCPGVFAGKTGYTMAAGRCLVSACKRNDMELICVTLDDPDDWQDHAALYDWAYSAFKEITFSTDNAVANVPVVGDAESIGAYPQKQTDFCMGADEKLEQSTVLAPFVFAPATGEYAGELVIGLPQGGEYRIPLYTKGTNDTNRRETVFRELVDRIIGVYAV